MSDAENFCAFITKSLEIDGDPRALLTLFHV
jgi:hypothetical protein